MLAMTYKTSRCTGSGFVGYDFKVWGVMVPAFVIRNYVELKSLRLLLSSYIARINKKPNLDCYDLKVMGAKLGFTAWLCYYLACSNLSFLDIGTDRAFTATAFKSIECE